MVGHLHHRQAGVLLVVRAKPAVLRAPPRRSGMPSERYAARSRVGVGTKVPSRVLARERRGRPTLRARFLEKHLAAPADDRGLDQRQALCARGGRALEHAARGSPRHEAIEPRAPVRRQTILAGSALRAVGQLGHLPAAEHRARLHAGMARRAGRGLLRHVDVRAFLASRGGTTCRAHREALGRRTRRCCRPVASDATAQTRWRQWFSPRAWCSPCP